MSVEVMQGGPTGSVAVLERAQQAYKDGALLHDLMDQERFPGLTALIANHAVLDVPHLFTTEEPRHPGNFLAFHERQKTIGALGMLATNALLRVSKVEEFKDAGEQTVPWLLGAFASISAPAMTDIRLEDRKVRKGKVVDGTVVFGSILLPVPDRTQARRLNGVLGAWLEAEDMESARSVYIDQSQSGSLAVEVQNSNEFDWRVMESALGFLKWMWMQRKPLATTLPWDKLSLDDWESGGETFSRLARPILAQIAKDYYWMVYEQSPPTYADEYAGSSPVIDPAPLGTTPAVIFEVVRKNSNGLSHQVRGRRNEEQNPNKKRRLTMERYINLRRRKIDAARLLKGPGSPREETILETNADKAKERLAEVAEHPFIEVPKAALKVGVAAVSLGIESALDLVWIPTRPKNPGRRVIKNVAKYNRQRREALEGRPRLGVVLDGLLQEARKTA